MADVTIPRNPIGIVGQLKHLSQSLDGVESALRQHQLALRQRAMSLPQGYIAELQKLRTDLDQVSDGMQDIQTDLIRLRSLSTTIEVVNSTLDLDAVLNTVIDNAIKLIRAERGYIVLRNEQTQELEFRAARNIEQRSLEQGELVVSNTVVRNVAQTGMPVVMTNAQDSSLSPSDSIVAFALRSIICVPLVLRGSSIGVIYADNRIKTGLFGEKERDLLFAFANQAAIAIENARLYENLQASVAQISAMNALMENIFASIASGVITTDPYDTLVILNDAASRILNLVQDTSRGRNLWQLMPQLAASLQPIAQQVRIEGEVSTIEVAPVIPERGKVNLNLRISPLRETQPDGGDNTQGMAFVVDDLTTQKQRTAQLEAIMRYLPPALVNKITDIDRLGLGGERREITTIFIEVRDLDTFPVGISPRDLMSRLNMYLTVAADAITQQNGVIDKYNANEVMGLFNTQLNESDEHPEKAILAALNAAKELAELYEREEERPAVPYFRVGINTGVATLGNVGSQSRKEFSAIGDSVNLAHRLLENAQPGQIITSEDTLRRCVQFLKQHPEFRVTPLQAIQVKGRSQLTQLYQISS